MTIMTSFKPVTSASRLAAALSGTALLCGTALLAAGCGVASSGHAAAPSSSSASSSPASSTPASTSSVPSSASVSAVAGARCPGAATAAAPPQVPALDAIQFVSAQQGWVAGAGHVLATSDSGKSWTPQYTGPATLDQVDFTDGQHGWAVGTSTLLRTTNGGATWTTAQDPCGAIRSVHFVTPDRGYAVFGGSQLRIDGGLPAPAAGGQLLTTTDGGQHWQPVAGAPPQAQTACFTSQSAGFLGTPGKVWSTSDGGQHWSLAFTEPAATAAAHPAAADTTLVECAGNGDAWVLFLGQGAALGHSPYLAYTIHDTHTARALFEEAYIESAARPAVHAPDGPGSYPGPFSAIGADTAVFVGFDPAVGYGTASVLTANGSGLTRAGNVTGISQPYGVAFASDTQGWVVGKNLRTGQNSIEATTNGGHTWTSQYQTR